MNDMNLPYTYRSNRGVKSYEPVPFTLIVKRILDDVNKEIGSSLNVCHINGYANEREHLGWHSDDSPEIDFSQPIAVVSFINPGEEREFWWRLIGEKGEVPPENKKLLMSGSLFVMPGGFSRHTSTEYRNTARHVVDGSV